MSINRYEYTFTCPNCKRRGNTASIKNKCLTCGEDVAFTAMLANQGWTALMILLLLLAGVLVIVTRF